MKFFPSLVLALVLLVPSSVSAMDLSDGFLSSGSLVISQKITVPAKGLAPLQGFFENEIVEADFSLSGSVILGGTISALAKKEATAKAPLLGFFQNDILADPKTEAVFKNLVEFSDSGSIVVGGKL